MNPSLPLIPFWPQLRSLLGEGDWAGVRQGIELSLGMGEDIVPLISNGLAISEVGRIEIGLDWISRTGIKISNRENAALLILTLFRSDELQGLKKLDLSDLEFISDLTSLERLKGLEEVRLDSCPSITDLSALSYLPKLRQLSAFGTHASLQPSTFLGLSSLERLTLEHYDFIDFSCLSVCSKLNLLVVRGAPSLSSLHGLGQCRELTRVSLGDCKSLRDISSLSSLSKLRDLSLDHMAGPCDLTSIYVCEQLESLRISHSKAVVDLSPLSRLNHLRSIDLTGTTVYGLEALLELTHLESLAVSSIEEYPEEDDLYGSPLIRDLNKLLGLKRMKQSFEGADVKEALCGMVLLALFSNNVRFPSWESVEKPMMRLRQILGERDFGRLVRGVKASPVVANTPLNSDRGMELSTFFWKKSPLGEILSSRAINAHWMASFVSWARQAL